MRGGHRHAVDNLGPDVERCEVGQHVIQRAREVSASTYRSNIRTTTARSGSSCESAGAQARNRTRVNACRLWMPRSWNTRVSRRAVRQCCRTRSAESPCVWSHTAYPSGIGPRIGNDVKRRWTRGYSSSSIGTSSTGAGMGTVRCYVRVMWSPAEAAPALAATRADLFTFLFAHHLSMAKICGRG